MKKPAQAVAGHVAGRSLSAQKSIGTFDCELKQGLAERGQPRGKTR
jgi:hypothetical protein